MYVELIVEAEVWYGLISWEEPDIDWGEEEDIRMPRTRKTISISDYK